MSLDISVQASLGDFKLDANFETPASGVTAIFGPSGCGKTSLLRAIAGLEPIDSGRVHIEAEVWHDEEVQLPVHQRGVGFVFQQASLFTHLNVQQNLEYGLKRKTIADQVVTFDEITSLLNLEPLLHRDVQALSGGESQRVAIGRALLASPKLLLMDEPLAAMDSTRKAEILPYLDKLHSNLSIPVIYVSHALDEVIKLADHLVLMEEGSIVSHGPLPEVLANHQGLHAMADEPFALLQGRVKEVCSDYHLTEVDVDGLSIRLPAMDVVADQEVRLRLYAKDISLNLVHQHDSSILNIFETHVVSIEDSSHPSQRLVRLKAGESQLLARVSKLSCENLKLIPGASVFAQIKAASLIQ